MNMSEVEVITRKWGNSLGITIPQEIVHKEHIRENQKLNITINLATNIQRIRGLVKFKKSAQQIKDEMRLGWQ